MTVLSDGATALETADIKAADGQGRSKQLLVVIKAAKAAGSTQAQCVTALSGTAAARGLSPFMVEGLIADVYGVAKNRK